jgi:drug/metabolite transporter (DMT)-like permease
MHFPLYLLLPLLSSLLYVAGILLIKRASAFGIGVWRTTFLANLTTFFFFLPLLAWGGKDHSWQLYWQPALTALLMIAGQSFTFLAIERGDVSIATPVMGLKIVIVAALTTVLLATPVPLQLWIAASISALAVALLNWGGGTTRVRPGQTIMLAVAAACSFALFDVLVQKWTPGWGAGRFLPIMFMMVALFSLGLMPFFEAPLRALPRESWPWLGGGSLFMALQALVLIVTLGVFGNATAVNVVYATRGLWSVLAVWLVGHWFHNQERHLGAQVLRYRLAGAALIFIALLLVLR